MTDRDSPADLYPWIAGGLFAFVVLGTAGGYVPDEENVLMLNRRLTYSIRALAKQGARVMALAASLILVACGTPTSSPTPPPPVLPSAPQLTFPEGTVPDVLARDGRFGTLLAILALTESPQGPPGQQTITPVLDLMIMPTWQHTLFAPTDASFTALPPATLEALLTDAGARLDFVRFHISQRVWAATELPQSGTIETPGGRIEVSRDGDRVTVGEAEIAEADLAATNGVVQVLDGFVWVPA